MIWNKKKAEETHEQKYERLCKKYGVAWDQTSPERLLGYDFEYFVFLYEEDKNLNVVPLARWDGLANSFEARNQTRLSLGERVCMQKYAASKMVEKYLKESKAAQR